MSRMIKIAIVDDHSLIRRGLRQLFEDAENMAVCCEAKNTAECLSMIKSNAPDVLVLDISLPDGSGLDLIRRIKAIKSDIAILVSSMHDETLFAERALQAGAMGYISKQEAAEHIIEAVHRIVQGKIYVSERMTERMLQKNLANNNKPTSIEALSDRELEVFEQIGSGHSTAQIAVNLKLSIKTIETHRAHIKQKLGLESAAELARHAVQWSLERS
jgi:DNA-binding NarL/FixJ family response regulator